SEASEVLHVQDMHRATAFLVMDYAGEREVLFERAEDFRRLYDAVIRRTGSPRLLSARFSPEDAKRRLAEAVEGAIADDPTLAGRPLEPPSVEVEEEPEVRGPRIALPEEPKNIQVHFQKVCDFLRREVGDLPRD